MEWLIAYAMPLAMHSIHYSHSRGLCFPTKGSHLFVDCHSLLLHVEAIDIKLSVRVYGCSAIAYVNGFNQLKQWA